MCDWDTLKQTCYTCTRCGLCETRNNVVFGVGREDADIMFVGEGPGKRRTFRWPCRKVAGRYALHY